MPYATRQAAEKFPVTLYTAANCVDACKQARDLLNGRGVPFSEKMLNSEQEIAELSKRLGGEAATPSIFVGQQSFKGFESGAWNNLLDLAGYPKSAPYGAKPSGAFTQ
jgi:glutaredoxin